MEAVHLNPMFEIVKNVSMQDLDGKKDQKRGHMFVEMTILNVWDAVLWEY